MTNHQCPMNAGKIDPPRIPDKVVAQAASLLYRRLPTCEGAAGSTADDCFRTRYGSRYGAQADWQSAEQQTRLSALRKTAQSVTAQPHHVPRSL